MARMRRTTWTAERSSVRCVSWCSAGTRSCTITSGGSTRSSVSSVERLENAVEPLVMVYYRPQTKLREGNVFIGVCLSFCSGEGVPMWPLAWYWTYPPPFKHGTWVHTPFPSSQTWGLGTIPPRYRQLVVITADLFKLGRLGTYGPTPLVLRSSDGHQNKHGRYASYWNAVLFTLRERDRESEFFIGGSLESP